MIRSVPNTKKFIFWNLGRFSILPQGKQYAYLKRFTNVWVFRFYINIILIITKYKLNKKRNDFSFYYIIQVVSFIYLVTNLRLYKYAVLLLYVGYNM